MHLDVHHLRVVRAVAESGSLSRAAAALGVTQPAASAQLKRLEQLLGYQLFERRGGIVVPTAMGDLLLRRITSVLPQMDRLLEDIGLANGADLPPSTARVGAVCSAVVAHLASAISSVWPEIDETTIVHDDDSDGLLALLEEGRAECAMVKDYPGYELTLPRAVDMAVVAVEPTFVMLPEHHPLACNAEIELTDLRDANWVLAGNGTSAVFTEFFTRTCADAGFVPDITHMVSSQPMAQMVVRSGAVGLVQPCCEGHAGVAIRPLRGEVLRRRHVLAWRGDTFVAERQEKLVAALSEAYWSEAERSPAYRRYLSCN
ncbi:transcriptional regulator, LysR family [Alloactinosynnema sp. L-07]|uniref:LysR family transcriptional regulator n=1 Tax=Alloactinosynnema sp. L-07 TaxID=1653480 RepID=UPI00065F0458|nr:LysR family transcriptional regulator [Alloactinosynnema sp. L-07]CRK58362.1 transcriptional regulator, LysR family [Alloactinosynnema sp. L-07]